MKKISFVIFVSLLLLIAGYGFSNFKATEVPHFPVYFPARLNIDEGGSTTFHVNFTKNPTQEECDNGEIVVKLVDVDASSNNLLTETTVSIPTGCTPSDRYTNNAVFTIQCINQEIVGSDGSSGESNTALSIQFGDEGGNHGGGSARCNRP